MTCGFAPGYKNTLYSLEKYDANRFCVFESCNKQMKHKDVVVQPERIRVFVFGLSSSFLEYIQAL
jgi:hypothetical protein